MPISARIVGRELEKSDIFSTAKRDLVKFSYDLLSTFFNNLISSTAVSVYWLALFTALTAVYLLLLGGGSEEVREWGGSEEGREVVWGSEEVREVVRE